MKYNQRINFCFLSFYSILIGCFFSVSAFAKNIIISTQKNEVSYSVEVADTPVLQQQGLMYRKNMPTNQGMLFVFQKMKPVSMWMKDTYIPLDMLFMDEGGVIRYIHENAKPLDETVIACPIPVKYVIELNAGQVQKNQIQVGHKVKDIS